MAVGDTAYALFSFQGMQDGTPVTFEVTDTSGAVLHQATQPWSFGSGEECVGVAFTRTSASRVIAVVNAGGQQLASNPVSFR